MNTTCKCDELFWRGRDLPALISDYKGVGERLRSSRRGSTRDERGANLVEFALIVPFLLLLLFGIIEFAWLFSQNLDVRHGSREGARLAAVNYPVGPTNNPIRESTQTDEIVAEICRRMDVARDASVTLTSTGGVGDAAVASVSSPARSLTGFMRWAIPSTMVLSSTVEIRLEQPAGWSDTTAQPCP
jgi:Flp pilus assembly protein TadG